jgi:kynureninase
MPATFTPAPGIAAWAISNPPIFSAAPLLASLPLFVEAGMAALRAKSLRLTGYLESLAAELGRAHLQIVTPADPAQRGCQLSLRVTPGPVHARRAFDAMIASGIIGDWREPDIIRLAPVPLYNSYEDVLRGIWQLARIVSAPAPG